MLSPFGGLVYLKSPNNSTDEVSVTLKNVMKAPYFDVKVPGTITNWETAKKEPGLWADICGEALRITLPSSSIRQEKSPKEVSVGKCRCKFVHRLLGWSESHRSMNRRDMLAWP